MNWNDPVVAPVPYGDWYRGHGSSRTVEDEVTETLALHGGKFNYDFILTEYRRAINNALPEGWALIGNTFYGPPPVPDNVSDTITEAIVSLSFWVIAARHEERNRE